MRKSVRIGDFRFISSVGIKRICLFTLILLCAPLAARAGGGTCPSDAQYINPANPTGSLVTLASLGVTNCFYVAANGSDSNSGTSEASPWQHAPGMVNCTAACKSTTPAAGQGFIFRGGDTWHYFTGSPQVGLPAGWPTGATPYAWDWVWSGTSSAEIYRGVDKTWFSGSAWARPIFTGDNTPVPGGIVSSCAFPQGNLDFIADHGVQYVQLDNFEFTGMCWNDMPNTHTNLHNYVHHFGANEDVSFRTYSNIYMHGWSLTAITTANCLGSRPPGTVCGGANGFYGDTHLEQGSLFVYDIVDGADSYDLTFDAFNGDGFDLEESVVRHVGGGNILDNCHLFHDNLFEYINNASAIDGTHSDMWFCNGEYPSDNFFYNNVIRFIGTEYTTGIAGGAPNLSTIFWFHPCTNVNANCQAQTGSTDYVFNNVGHDINCNGNCNNFSNPTSGTATMMVYNNTWESMNNLSIWANGVGTGFVVTDQNNHYITNNGTGCAAVWNNTTVVNGRVTSCSGDVFQTIAAANAQGYTSANDFAPTAISTATVGKAVNETGLADTFGPAFLHSTSNGCAYNTGNHTVTCPAVTVANRLSSGNWDAGAYISGSSNADQPPAPSNLAATVNN
jgi:hypothetical protein